ncbi:hypothetical protein Q5752_006769 [Cryptotrichosporon argae]
MWFHEIFATSDDTVTDVANEPARRGAIPQGDQVVPAEQGRHVEVVDLAHSHTREVRVEKRTSVCMTAMYATLGDDANFSWCAY